MPGKSEQSKKRKTSVKVQDMRAKQNPKAGKNTEAKAKPIFTTFQHTESTKRLPCCWARNKSSLLRFRQQKPQHPTSNAQRPIQKGRAVASSVGESVSLHQLVGMQHWLRLPAMSRGNHHPILNWTLGVRR